MAKTSYAIALGSNRRHGRHGAPAGVLAAAIEAVRAVGDVEAQSTIVGTPALGPAGRGFANAVGALTCTQKGGIPALPTREAAERFLNGVVE